MGRILNRLNTWFRPRRHYDDLAEELQLHIELRARKLREAGMSADEAQWAARRQFGNSQQIQEECRSAWSARWLDELRQDVVYSLRSMRRTSVFTAAAILTLTLGIAANTTVFAFINALVLRPLPVQDPSGLVMLTVHESVENVDIPAFCYPAFEGIARRAQTVAGLFTWNETELTLGWGADAHRVHGGVASGAYYRTLGIRPAAGRFFGPADDRADAGAVAVLSYAVWQSQFGGARSAIGRTIHLDGHPFTIIGVEPRGFGGMTVSRAVDITVPMHANAALHPRWNILHSTGMWWLAVFGRLRPGTTQQAANAEIRALTAPVLDDLHFKLDDLDIHGTSAAKPRQIFGIIDGSHGNRQAAAGYDKPLYVLICISLAVLGIGCLNVANLLLARAVARERELAVRMALGARVLRIIRQLITESLLLSFAGTVFGSLAALWLTRAAAHLITTSGVTPDWRVLCFISLLALCVTLLFGVAPALRGVALGAAALKTGRVGSTFSSARLSQSIVCVQIALSLALISGALLFSKSFNTLRGQDVGFDRTNLVFCGLNADRSGMNAAQMHAFWEEVLRGLGSTPGISSATLTAVVPLSGDFSWSDMASRSYPRLTREQRQLYTHRVSPNYFRTMKIPLLAGRDFNDSDASSTLRLGILSEKAAALYLPGRSAIGETLDVEGTPVRIVGVVKDARYQGIRDAAPQTLYYDTLAGAPNEEGMIASDSVIVRTTYSAGEVANILRGMIKRSGKDVSLDAAMTFDQAAEAMLVRDRLLAVLASGFAAIGCLLAAIGIYGVIAYSVARRTPEIGIRIALGALRGDVVWGVLRQALVLAALGIAAGIALALTCGRLFAALLYQTRTDDAMILVTTIALLLIVVTTAGLIPAVRASRVDPMTALRWE